jgi:hypothetical protein
MMGRAEDPNEWNPDAPVRVELRNCFSIREFRRNRIGWTPEFLYGPWHTHDLVRYRCADGSELCAMTRVIYDDPLFEIHAYEPPPLGVWHEIEPPEEIAA